MEYTPSFRDRLYADVIPSFSHAITEDQKYGIPELNKFPMPDAAHVRSAIKFFNYVTPAHEQQLASAILARMQEYGISADSLNIGDENRFKKYLQHDSLIHHGIKGQKWGVRRFQNPDGSYTALGAANRKQLSKIDRKYDKLAKKDAKEYARAKMSYGEGAGNRRKLIKNKVEQRRKENEHYNKVFDEYLAQEDMSKHADAAKRERTAKDAAKTTKRAAKTAVKVFNTVAPLLHDDETDAYLAHHGIKGQKWGIRRYQNEDGSLTPRGQKRYNKNKQYLDQTRAKEDQLIKNNKDYLDRYSKATKSIKNEGYDYLHKEGFDDDMINRAIEVTKAQRNRYQAMGEDVLKHQIDMSKKISDIDPSAQSYRKTKKLVKDIIKESVAYEQNAHNAYLNSPEYLRYRRERFGY